MKNLKPKLDWQMDDENVWQAAPEPQAAPTPKRLKFSHIALAAALILLFTGGWLWLRPAPAKDASDQRPATTLQSTAPSDAQASPHPTQTPTAVALDPTLLGPQRSLTVANFTILYRAADADAVYQAVPQLEELYATLRQDAGLPALVSGVAYTIEISAGNRLAGNFFDYNQRKLAIYSPTLLSAPVAIAPATLIEQATIYPLAHLLIHELINRHDPRWQYNFSRWYPLENAFALWQLWREDGPLAADHAGVITWLYANSKNATSRQPLPANYTQLCRTHRIWQLIPNDLSIPLACSKEDTTMLSADRYPALAATWPQQINDPSQGVSLSSSAISASLTLESLLDYIVATYGRDKLPHLLETLGNHSSPDTLIPALFGVSRSEFEGAWQAYLAQHY